jgi:hypothetical protein
VEEEDKSIPGSPGAAGEAKPATPQLFAKARDEFRFAYEHGLMTRGTIIDWELMIQVVLADEATARGLKRMIEHEAGGWIYKLAAFESREHSDRWIVQMPLDSAREAGLLPVRITRSNFLERLSPRASGNPDLLADVRANEISEQEAGPSRFRKLINRFRGAGRERS